jgi:hypothetical protein
LLGRATKRNAVWHHVEQRSAVSVTQGEQQRASLIQLYSSLIYKGVGLIDDIKNDLVSTLLRTGRDALAEIVGADAARITAEDWPV